MTRLKLPSLHHLDPMNYETIPEPTLPEWLCASDLWRSIQACSEPTSSKGRPRLIPPELRDLPVCELDCGDPIRIYKAMGAWCLPWSEIPLVVFFPAWMKLIEQVRGSLIEQYRYFKEELNPNQWYQNICGHIYNKLLLSNYLIKLICYDWIPICIGGKIHGPYPVLRRKKMIRFATAFSSTLPDVTPTLPDVETAF